MTEIVKTPQIETAQPPPRNTDFDRLGDALKQADQLGQWIASSGMFGCEKIEQGKILALSAILERRTPIDLLRRQHLMFGRLTMRADAMLAEFCARPGNKWEWIHLGDDKTDASAKVTTPQQTMVVTYAWSDAEKAGYSKRTNKDGSPNQYQKDPGAMLRARLITKAIRILAPEVIVGVRSLEELNEEVTDTAPRIDLHIQAAASAPCAVAASGVMTTQPIPETAKIVDAIVTETPSPVVAKVAQEMKERAEQPLPADIQPTGKTVVLHVGSAAGKTEIPAGANFTQPPQAQATVGIITTPALPLAETPKPAAAVTSAMPLATQQWLADWCKPVGVIAATEFMRAKEWLPKDGNLEDLSESFVSLIKKKPIVVLNQIKAHAAKQSSPA